MYEVKTPEYSRPIGRPRTQRRRDRDEVNGITKNPRQCGKCHQFGHNRVTCKGAPAGVQTQGPAYYAGPHVRRASGRGRGMRVEAGQVQVGARGGRANNGRGGGRRGGNNSGRRGRGHSESNTYVDGVGTSSGRVYHGGETSTAPLSPQPSQQSQSSQQSNVTQVTHSNPSTQNIVDTPTYSYTRNPTLFIPPMPENLSRPVIRNGGVKMRGGGVGRGATSTPSISNHGGKRSKIDEHAWKWSSPPVPSPPRRSGRISGGLGSKLNGMHIDLD